MSGNFPNNPFSICRRYRKDTRGAAAAEFALILTLMTVPLLNVIDFTLYAWYMMQVDNAAQVAAQAAWGACPTNTFLPALTKCPNLVAATNTAVQSTRLGGSVSISSRVEGYYCVNTAGVLQSVVSSTSCTAVNNTSGDKPGDYIQIRATYTFTPIFPALSLAASMPSPIVRTAWMRLA